MAKVTAPLLGFGASGQIGKTQVYGSWRGVPYARRHVIPANPRSADQLLTRNAFAWLTQVWKLAGPDFIAPWNAFAVGKQLVGRNAFIGQNTKALRSQTALTDMIMSPGAKGGLPAASVVFTGGAGQIDAAITVPDLPTGWTITKGILVAIEAQNPQTDSNYTSYSNSDASAPYDPTITGLAAGTYECGAWLVYAKGDGSVLYGPSIMGTATVT